MQDDDNDIRIDPEVGADIHTEIRSYLFDLLLGVCVSCLIALICSGTYFWIKGIFEVPKP